MDHSKRSLKRPPPHPLRVSQRTSLAALGVPERKFLELIRELGIPHTCVGQLRLVDPVVFLAAIERDAANTNGGAVDGIEAELNRIGLRSKGGTR